MTRLLLLGVMTLGATLSPELVLEKHRAGQVEVGKPVQAIRTQTSGWLVREVERDTEGYPVPAVEVYVSVTQAAPSLIAYPDEPGGVVQRIEVEDPRFRTPKGIGIGSTLGQLRRAYGPVVLVSGEGTVCATSEQLEMSFCLRVSPEVDARIAEIHASEGAQADISAALPDSTRIASVVIL